MTRSFLTNALVLLAVLAFTACGAAEENGTATGTSSAATTAQTTSLTQDQLENGIGPIRSVELGPLNEELAEQGAAVFNSKCAACHKMNQRYVGPALGDVLDRRTPEFIMNMMLNPDEMIKQHPEAKQMLAEFLTPMPDQNLTEDDARAILEYLRQVQNGTDQE